MKFGEEDDSRSARGHEWHRSANGSLLRASFFLTGESSPE